MEFDSRGEGEPSRWELFGVSGPVYLTSVDWGKADETRTVTASLVQGVYILERDRQLRRTEDRALAPIWWEFFHFRCIQVLVDPIDFSIFGAIYRYNGHKPRAANPYDRATSSQRGVTHPPRYIIAFRGTLMKADTRRRDLCLDVQLPLKGLPYDPRYHRALEAVQGLVAQVGDTSSVWIAGHSLGAAIALQVGKDIARRGTYMETYLFNPPYNSAPIERINSSGLKTKMRVAKSVVTAGLSLALKGNNPNTAVNSDPFSMLCCWIPQLFVNPKDPISCEYIGYFEHRDRMEVLGMGEIEKIATKNSIMNMLSVGALGRQGEPSHLLPSALLIKNLIVAEQNVKVAHGIHQWLQPHPWDSHLYIYHH